MRAEGAGGRVPGEDAESARGLVERPGQVGAGALAVQAVHSVVAVRATPVACSEVNQIKGCVSTTARPELDLLD